MFDIYIYIFFLLVNFEVSTLASRRKKHHCSSTSGALGRVIAALARRDKFVSFRDSALTQMLKQPLTGGVEEWRSGRMEGMYRFTWGVCCFWDFLACTLKVSAISHLKMDGWNSSFLLGQKGYFQVRTVSFRECTFC